LLLPGHRPQRLFVLMRRANEITHHYHLWTIVDTLTGTEWGRTRARIQGRRPGRTFAWSSLRLFPNLDSVGSRLAQLHRSSSVLIYGPPPRPPQRGQARASGGAS
jgi:hypothetical protein